MRQVQVDDVRQDARGQIAVHTVNLQAPPRVHDAHIAAFAVIDALVSGLVVGDARTEVAHGLLRVEASVIRGGELGRPDVRLDHGHFVAADLDEQHRKALALAALLQL